MDKKLSQRKVLVVGGKSDKNTDLIENLQQCFDLTVVNSTQEAQRLLTQQSFDAVFSEADLYHSNSKEHVSEQAVEILNTIGEGVCLVGMDGIVLWENNNMADYDKTIKDGISKVSHEAFEAFRKISYERASESPLKHRKRSFIDPESNRYFELITTPMYDENEALTQVATVIWEATDSRRLQQRIDAIDKSGRELVRLDAEAIKGKTVEQRISLLQDKIVKYAKDLLYFDHFVVRILNRKSNQLEVLFGVGLPQEAEDIEIFANNQNNGITGYVVATGRSYICNNPDTDPKYLPGLPDSKCTLTVPLRIYDNVIGALNVESGKQGAFGEEDRQVAEIFGRYIAMALNFLDLLVVERFETSSQAADNLSRELSQPLNDIINSASLLIEDYIGHDDIRHRLGKIIDNVTNIKAAVKDAQSGPKGILGSHRIERQQQDPQLHGKHVLVVDDEMFIRQTIADVIQKNGMIADTASDGKIALALISQRQYDLVISDIKLPHANGYEIFSAVKEGNENTPVILMTGFGYDPNHSIVRANREGLSAVLYKPFKVEQLMMEVRQAIVAR